MSTPGGFNLEVQQMKISIQHIALPPNHGIELTGLKRHALCKSQEQRARRFRHAADAKR
jgi:hypothetical protein